MKLFSQLCGGMGLVLLPISLAFAVFKPLPQLPPIPEDNPLSEEKIELGKQLFFDKRLSKNENLSCNSCHNILTGGNDGLEIPTGSVGIKHRRNTPTVWNSGYHTSLHWDGEALSLEHQFTMHLVDKSVLANTQEQLEQRIGRISAYKRQFASVFGEEGVTVSNIAKALATFQRTLNTTNSPFDRYLNGEESAISVEAKRGFETFQEVECSSCHFYVNLAGPQPGIALKMGEGFWELFPNTRGTQYEEQYDLITDDLGRYNYTGDEEHKIMWRVPTLRNVAITAPYFHNGKVKTLDEAVRVMAATELDRKLTEQQVADIVEFLKSLTGKFPAQTLPRLPDDAGIEEAINTRKPPEPAGGVQMGIFSIDSEGSMTPFSVP